MKTIAVFDFDGTITTKDSLWEFLKFSQSGKRLVTGMFCLSPILFLYLIKIVSNEKAKEKLFRWFFKGWNIDEFNRICIDFIPKINQILRTKTIEKINEHQSKGDKLLIISASIENWIKPWADQNGFDTVIATQIEVDKLTKITGKFLTANCYGNEKVNRLLAAFPARKNYYLYAYGDSKGDKELIEFADKGFYIQDME